MSDFLDITDRQILKFLLDAQRPVTGNQVSKRIKLTPPAVNERLKDLYKRGYVKKIHVGKDRVYKRDGKTIRAPSKVAWAPNVED